MHLTTKGLRELSTSYPLETIELLYKFRIDDDKNKCVDLTEMCLHLRNDNMLPCLTFHLNAFEAIALFKQLLGKYIIKTIKSTYIHNLQYTLILTIFIILNTQYSMSIL